MARDNLLDAQQAPLVQYRPDRKVYEQRTARRLKAGISSKPLPPGLPRQLTSPLAWKGSQFKPDEWVASLDEAEVAEIIQAVAIFKGL